MHTAASRIIKLSTAAVEPSRRLSYGSWLVSSSLLPSSLYAEEPDAYALDIEALALPKIAIVLHGGSPQRAIRARQEIGRTEQNYFNLVLVLNGAWQVTHHSRMRFEPGDLIFYDSRYPLDCDLLSEWRCFNLQMTEQFVRKWVPNPAWLWGRRIARDSQWGRVLASYVAQLSPEFVIQAPLPESILVDQIGALLALTATELSGAHGTVTPSERTMRDRIADQIRQRCTDNSLQAADVASALDVSKRTLHRALAACGETFGAMLIEARFDLAVRMLQSPLFDRVTIAEVGRRAGFSDASHFTKVVRRRTGQTPMQMRRTKAN
jgi:AraC family transcriptional activator of tynA and feaB